MNIKHHDDWWFNDDLDTNMYSHSHTHTHMQASDSHTEKKIDLCVASSCKNQTLYIENIIDVEGLHWWENSLVFPRSPPSVWWWTPTYSRTVKGHTHSWLIECQLWQRLITYDSISHAALNYSIFTLSLGSFKTCFNSTTDTVHYVYNVLCNEGVYIYVHTKY